MSTPNAPSVQCGAHRLPDGPCEDLVSCPRCRLPTYALRPEGETFGFHARDCSAPAVHEGQCPGGGAGHRPGLIRGYWSGFSDDVRAEHEWWASTSRGSS
jgi:hypothetical protein